MERAVKSPDLYQLMDLVFLVIETPRIMNRVKELLRAFLTRMVQTASVLGAQTPVAGWDEWSGARVSSIWIPPTSLKIRVNGSSTKPPYSGGWLRDSPVRTPNSVDDGYSLAPRHQPLSTRKLLSGFRAWAFGPGFLFSIREQ